MSFILLQCRSSVLKNEERTSLLVDVISRIAQRKKTFPACNSPPATDFDYFSVCVFVKLDTHTFSVYYTEYTVIKEVIGYQSIFCEDFWGILHLKCVMQDPQTLIFFSS